MKSHDLTSTPRVQSPEVSPAGVDPERLALIDYLAERTPVAIDQIADGILALLRGRGWIAPLPVWTFTCGVCGKPSHRRAAERPVECYRCETIMDEQQ